MERSEAIEQIVDILPDEVLRKIAEEVYTVARAVGED